MKLVRLIKELWFYPCLALGAGIVGILFILTIGGKLLDWFRRRDSS